MRLSLTLEILASHFKRQAQRLGNSERFSTVLKDGDAVPPSKSFAVMIWMWFFLIVTIKGLYQKCGNEF